MQPRNVSGETCATCNGTRKAAKLVGPRGIPDLLEISGCPDCAAGDGVHSTLSFKKPSIDRAHKGYIMFYLIIMSIIGAATIEFYDNLSAVLTDYPFNVSPSYVPYIIIIAILGSAFILIRRFSDIESIQDQNLLEANKELKKYNTGLLLKLHKWKGYYLQRE